MTRATFRNEDDARAAWRALHWWSLSQNNPWGKVVAFRDECTVTIRDEHAGADTLREFAQIADAIGGVTS